MSRIRSFAVLVPIAVVLGLASASIAGASGYCAPGVKQFTVTVTGTTGASPDAFAGDDDATVTIRLTNKSSNQVLGSANVTVPAPFTLVSAPADTMPGGPVLELRNLNLAPNAAVDVPVVVQVATCGPATPAPFAVAAKTSSGFTGTGNDFTRIAPSDLQLNVIGTCSLSFVGQPTSTTRSTTITTVGFTPLGAPVSVEVRDASGTARSTGSAATVGLTAANPTVPSPVLAGTTSVTAVAGLATFAPGPTLGVSADGYTLVASSAGLTTSPPSAPFAIVDDRVSCPAGQACARSAQATKGTEKVVVTFGTGQTAANLVVSLGAADVPAFECAGYPRPAGSSVSQFTFTGGSGADRSGTLVASSKLAGRSLSSIRTCWAAPYAFTTRSGAPATVQGTKPGTGQPLFVGLLPDCGWHSGAPCVQCTTYSHATDTVTVTIKTTGQDPWRY